MMFSATELPARAATTDRLTVEGLGILRSEEVRGRLKNIKGFFLEKLNSRYLSYEWIIFPK